MHTDNPSAEEIGKHPAVSRARRWRDRINIDVRGRPSFQHGMPVFKGESSARIRLQGTYLTIERGPGATSPEWEANLSSLVSWLCSRGVLVQIRMQPHRLVAPTTNVRGFDLRTHPQDASERS